MKVIKLKTEDGRHEVTDIRPVQNNPDRVSIFVDENFNFSLDIAQLIEYGLKVGSEISEEELIFYHKASNFGRLYQQTLQWLAYRPRSVQETRDYLNRKKLDKKRYHPVTDEEINMVLDKLRAKNYLNDLDFAQYYVEHRFQTKGISKLRLQNELKVKGIEGWIIDKVLSEYDRTDEEEIQKMITKKAALSTYAITPDLPEEEQEERKQKLVGYLTRQGFTFQLSREAVDEYWDEILN